MRETVLVLLKGRWFYRWCLMGAGVQCVCVALICVREESILYIIGRALALAGGLDRPAHRAPRPLP